MEKKQTTKRKILLSGRHSQIAALCDCDPCYVRKFLAGDIENFTKHAYVARKVIAEALREIDEMKTELELITQKYQLNS